MGKFIKNLCVVLLLLLAVSTAVQVAVSWRIRNKSIYGQDNFHIYKNQDNSLIFLGSSRCTRHFDPHFFKDSLGISSVNLGVTGHGDLTMAMIRLKYYLKYNKAPKVALLNYDPMTAYGPYDLNANTNLIEKNYYSGYAFMPNQDNAPIVDYFHFNAAERYLPLYALLKYGTIMDVAKMKGGKLWAADGYKRDDTQWDTVKYPLDPRMFTNTYKLYVEQRDSVKQHLARFSDYCKAQHIKLVCVQSPVFMRIYDARAYGVIGQVCAGLGIPFIEGNVDSIDNDVRNFSDLDHLNTIGIAKFMRLVVSDPRFASFFN